MYQDSLVCTSVQYNDFYLDTIQKRVKRSKYEFTFMTRLMFPTLIVLANRINFLHGWFGLVWFYGVQWHFQQYFSYILAVSFIGGGNRSTQ